MKLEDMILVKENKEDEAEKYLQTFADFMESKVEKLMENYDIAFLIFDLFESKKKAGYWSEISLFDGTAISARYCDSIQELRGFLFGEVTEKDHRQGANGERCSMECLEVLKIYNMNLKGGSLELYRQYQRIEHTFENGEIIKNLNGNEYRILKKLTEENLLLMAVKTGEICVACGTKYFACYPKEYSTEDIKKAKEVQKGVEWNHGIYLGSDITQIDFEEMVRSYGEKELSHVYDYRREAMAMYDHIHNLCHNELLTTVEKQGLKQLLDQKFGRGHRDDVLSLLANGNYDYLWEDKIGEEIGQETEKERFTDEVEKYR